MCILTYKQYNCSHLAATPSVQRCDRTMKSIFCELRNINRIDEECPACIDQAAHKDKNHEKDNIESDLGLKNKLSKLLAASSVNKITYTGVVRDGKAYNVPHKYDSSYKFKPLCSCRNLKSYGRFKRKPMPSVCRNVVIRGASTTSLEAREKRLFENFDTGYEEDLPVEEESEYKDVQVYTFSWDEESEENESIFDQDDDDDYDYDDGDVPLPMTLVFRCATASNILGKNEESKKPALTITTKQVFEPRIKTPKLIETPSKFNEQLWLE